MMRSKAKYLRGWKRVNRIRWRKYKQKWRKRYRHKYNAHAAVNYAVKTGKLIRPKRCSKCGKRCKPEAHHPNYAKRLKVVWLCRPCHLAI